MTWLYPPRTGQTVVDRWTLAHVAFWIFYGSSVAGAGVALDMGIMSMIVVATLWEVFERFAERRWPKLWKHPESIANILSDVLFTGPVGVLVGYWIAKAP